MEKEKVRITVLIEGIDSLTTGYYSSREELEEDFLDNLEKTLVESISLIANIREEEKTVKVVVVP